LGENGSSSSSSGSLPPTNVTVSFSNVSGDPRPEGFSAGLEMVAEQLDAHLGLLAEVSGPGGITQRLDIDLTGSPQASSVFELGRGPPIATGAVGNIRYSHIPASGQSTHWEPVLPDAGPVPAGTLDVSNLVTEGDVFSFDFSGTTRMVHDATQHSFDIHYTGHVADVRYDGPSP
jgi:hypothetical protein